MSLFRIMVRKVHSFWTLSLFIQLWIVPTWLVLGIARALILSFSFKRLADSFGTHHGVTPWIPLLSNKQEQTALQLGRVVRLAAAYTPWESNCFPQAITARLLLALYGIPYALNFGLAKDVEKGEMKAHAWVVAGRIRVTGGYSFAQYTVVACFASDTQPDKV